jgi:hypothetical protein
MTKIDGMVDLLRQIAGRLENGAGELRKDFLLEVADKVERLEEVSKAAGFVVNSVPRRKKRAVKSLVPRELISNLSSAVERSK